MAKHIITRLFFAWAPVVIWMIVIFTFSNKQRITVSPEYVLNFIFFKTLHVVEYAMLYLLSVRAIHMTHRKSGVHIYRWAFFLTLLYAISDEIHQMFVPTREGTARDVIIDCIGASSLWYYLASQSQRVPKKLKILARSLDLIF